jgi:hypothetical protein
MRPDSRFAWDQRRNAGTLRLWRQSATLHGARKAFVEEAIDKRRRFSN